METEQKQNDKRGGNEMGAIVNVEGTVTVKEKDMVNEVESLISRQVSSKDMNLTYEIVNDTTLYLHEKTSYWSESDLLDILNASPCAGEVLQRIVSHGFDPVLHVYEFQSTKYMFPWEVQEYVPDAIYSGECWLLEKPKSFIHKCYNVSSFKTESVKDFYENKWEAVVNIQLEKMKKNETNWERYCHIYGFGYKFLRVVHDMNISFKTFALSLDL